MAPFSRSLHNSNNNSNNSNNSINNCNNTSSNNGNSNGNSNSNWLVGLEQLGVSTDKSGISGLGSCCSGPVAWQR